jgi:nitrite reductase/ring-hydroxylating ferredoxin subunit
MANLQRAAGREEIPPGRGRCVELGGRAIALFNVDGAFFALDNTCAHRGGPLGEGSLDGSVVTCPWHGWKFDCRTGASLTAPGKSVASYPVRVEGNDILVELG